MASKTLSQIEPKTEMEKNLHQDFTSDLDMHDGAIGDYDAYEAMDMGKTFDPVSRETGNGLTDNMTATIYLERAARVAGQVPEGETQAIGKKDTGKGMFLDMLRTKWIVPNANAQFDFLTKLFLLQYGSSQYNIMVMHFDINVNETTGYIGPDCWLWNPRNFIPQAGETSVTDMDYAHAISYKSPQFFEDILEDKDDNTWKKDAIEEIKTQLKNKKKGTDTKRDTLAYRDRMTQDTNHIAVVTRYEAGKKGRWITFLPDFGCKVIRNIKNPHKNARIPFIIKRCIPKQDSYYGNGDFQRSMPMQFANDGLDNFYFQGIKVNLFPKTLVNMQTAVRHTISNDVGSIWEFNGTPEARHLEGSNAGLSTYQAAKGMSKGAIQSIAGTTDTRSNQESSSDPGFGKTPEALKQIKEREGTRDNFDRGMLERSIVELYEGWYSILPTIKDKIPVDVFSEEIEEIMESGYTDLAEMIKKWEAQGDVEYRLSDSGNQIRFKFNPEAFKGIKAKFQIKMNSTFKETREQQLTSMQDQLAFIGKMPNALQEFREATGKVVNWEFVFGEMGKLGGLPFMEKMFMQGAAPTQGQQTMGGAEGEPMNPGVAPEGMGEMPPEMPMGMPEQPEMMAEMPMGMNPAQQASQPQMNPEFLKVIAQASPEMPVYVGEGIYDDPQMAMQAYIELLATGQI